MGLANTTCEHCKTPLIEIISEPEGKILRFDSARRVAWRMVEVTGTHTVAVPTEVYDLHVLTCKAINNNT